MRRELVQVVRADHVLVCADHLGALWEQRGDRWVKIQEAIDENGQPVVLMSHHRGGSRSLAIDTDGNLRELREGRWTLLMAAPEEAEEATDE